MDLLEHPHLLVGDLPRALPAGPGVVRVGRGLGADLGLADPTVSRRHATLVRTGDLVELHDEGSTNGTYVNGRRITSIDLADGDVISFGRATVIFRDPTPLSALWSAAA